MLYYRYLIITQIYYLAWLSAYVLADDQASFHSLLGNRFRLVPNPQHSTSQCQLPILLPHNNCQIKRMVMLVSHCYYQVNIVFYCCIQIMPCGKKLSWAWKPFPVFLNILFRYKRGTKGSVNLGSWIAYQCLTFGLVYCDDTGNFSWHRSLVQFRIRAPDYMYISYETVFLDMLEFLLVVQHRLASRRI